MASQHHSSKHKQHSTSKGGSVSLLGIEAKKTKKAKKRKRAINKGRKRQKTTEKETDSDFRIGKRGKKTYRQTKEENKEKKKIPNKDELDH